MAIYFLLGTTTPKGQKLLSKNPEHIAEAAARLDSPGAKLLGQYTVLGRYDLVAMVLADDNHAVARLSAEFGRITGMHFETLSGVSAQFMNPDPPEGPNSEDETAAAAAVPSEFRIT